MAMVVTLYRVLLIGLIVSCSSGFIIRLWPLNERETEGFVEIFYEDEWGILGHPSYRFSDLSASFLCKRLGISTFGYGGLWTPVGSYKGYMLLPNITCDENESCDIPPYSKSSFPYDADAESFYYKYAPSIHCVDSRLINGSTYNEGILQTAIDGNVYTVCFEGFDMNTAKVACNHIGFNGAVVITAVDPGETTIYSNGFICDGSEYSLLECNQTVEKIQTCQKIVQLTCQAIRMTSSNEYSDEGALEIFYNGTWGFVGDPGYKLTDVTARYMCDRFGFGLVGFGALGHPLKNYDRIAWHGQIECLGNEAHVMQCDLNNPSVVPPLKHTYQRGSWLYCFDFDVSNVRLFNGSSYNEGMVQLEINGRWGFIDTNVMDMSEMINAGNGLCQTMGFLSVKKANGTLSNCTELIWMFAVDCNGKEGSITDCTFLKGAWPMSYKSPEYLELTCEDYNDCVSNPCLKNGTCIDAFNDVTCVCPSPWGGHLCDEDVVDDCQLDYCFNGATCIDGIESYTCQCADGFDGVQCQNNIDDCGHTPCKNNGHCVDRINGYICLCRDGFEGEQCQNEETNQMLLIVILATFVGLLLTTTAIIICCCIYRRKSVTNESPGVDQSSPTDQRLTTFQTNRGFRGNGTDVSNITNARNRDFSSRLHLSSVQSTNNNSARAEDVTDVYHSIHDTQMINVSEDKNGYLSFEMAELENPTQTKGNNKADTYESDNYLTPIQGTKGTRTNKLTTTSSEQVQRVRDKTSYATVEYDNVANMPLSPSAS